MVDKVHLSLEAQKDLENQPQLHEFSRITENRMVFIIMKRSNMLYIINLESPFTECTHNIF